MLVRLFQDAASRRPERQQHQRDGTERQQAAGNGDERPGGQPGADRDERILLTGGVDHRRGLGRGRAEPGQVAGDECPDPRRRRRRHHGRGEGAPHQQRAVTTSQEEPAEQQTHQPVRADDVAGHEESGVHETEDDQPQAPSAQDSDRRPLVRARRGLAQEQLHHPVAEEEREQRIDPQVEHGDHQELDHLVRQRAADRMPSGRTVRCRPQVEPRVGQDDQRQHQPAGKIGREGAFGGQHAAAGDHAAVRARTPGRRWHGGRGRVRGWRRGPVRWSRGGCGWFRGWRRGPVRWWRGGCGRVPIRWRTPGRSSGTAWVDVTNRPIRHTSVFGIRSADRSREPGRPASTGGFDWWLRLVASTRDALTPGGVGAANGEGCRRSMIMCHETVCQSGNSRLSDA